LWEFEGHTSGFADKFPIPAAGFESRGVRLEIAL
jgi:hypothetical protein